MASRSLEAAKNDYYWRVSQEADNLDSDKDTELI